MKKKNKLRAYWNKKEKDTMFYHPAGYMVKCDAAFLHTVFTKEFRKELEDRGYDWTTFKFEISPKLPNNKFDIE